MLAPVSPASPLEQTPAAAASTTTAAAAAPTGDEVPGEAPAAKTAWSDELITATFALVPNEPASRGTGVTARSAAVETAGAEAVIAEAVVQVKAAASDNAVVEETAIQEAAGDEGVPEEMVDLTTTGSVAFRSIATSLKRLESTPTPAEGSVPPTAAETVQAAIQPMPRINDARRTAAIAGDGAEVFVVGGQGVSVRSGPSRASARLFALPAGKEVQVSRREKGWLRVTDDKNRTGWAYSSFFSKR